AIEETIMRGTTAIVGVGESQYYRAGGAPDTEYQLAITAIRNAAEDAGVDVKDLDGYVTYSMDRNQPTRVLTAPRSRQLRFAAYAVGGGNCVASTLAIADAALTAGYADYVVCYRSLAQGQFGRYGQAGANATARAAGEASFRAPYGLVTPAQNYAMSAKR